MPILICNWLCTLRFVFSMLIIIPAFKMDNNFTITNERLVKNSFTYEPSGFRNHHFKLRLSSAADPKNRYIIITVIKSTKDFIFVHVHPYKYYVNTNITYFYRYRNTVDSCYLEVEGTFRNTSTYPYFELSDLTNWKKNRTTTFYK